MKKLYWLILSMISPVHSDDYKRLGEGEYLAKHGVANEVNEEFSMVRGQAVIQLQKHLKHI